MKYLLVFLLLVPGLADAQQRAQLTFDQITARQDAREMRVATSSVTVYADRSTTSDVVTRYLQDERVLAYDQRGPFVAVARPGVGHVGYAPITHLSDVDRPLLRSAPRPDAATPPATEPPPPEPQGTRTLIEVEPKSVGTAVALSFIVPGGGQFYAGDHGRGAVYLVGATIAPLLGATISAGSVEASCETTTSGATIEATCSDDTNYVPLYVGVAAASVFWIASMAEAPGSVRDYNARLIATRSGEVGVALAIRLP